MTQWLRNMDRFKAPKRRPTRGTVKSKVGVMMWLCICSDGRSVLLRCPERVNSEAYQNAVLAPNLRFIRHNNPAFRSEIVFQQDGAPPHTSASTKAFLDKHRVNLLPKWPPSPLTLTPLNIVGLRLLEPLWVVVSLTKQPLNKASLMPGPRCLGRTSRPFMPLWCVG